MLCSKIWHGAFAHVGKKKQNKKTKKTTKKQGFSMGSNQYWAGRVYDLCVYFMTGTPKGSTESKKKTKKLCGFSMGSNQYWAGRVYGCVCIL